MDILLLVKRREDGVTLNSLGFGKVKYFLLLREWTCVSMKSNR
jgi:hypothetical protein